MSAKTRRDDPWTRYAVARGILDLTVRQAATFTVLAVGPATHHGLIVRYQVTPRVPPQTDQSIRTRCTELVEMGIVERSGDYAPTPTSQRSIVWRVVDLPTERLFQ